jgi:hypothetical protein
MEAMLPWSWLPVCVVHSALVTTAKDEGARGKIELQKRSCLTIESNDATRDKLARSANESDTNVQKQ